MGGNVIVDPSAQDLSESPLSTHFVSPDEIDQNIGIGPGPEKLESIIFTGNVSNSKEQT